MFDVQVVSIKSGKYYISYYKCIFRELQMALNKNELGKGKP